MVVYPVNFLSLQKGNIEPSFELYLYPTKTWLKETEGALDFYRKESGYTSSEDTIKALKKAGFKPIEVAGVFGNGINFLNAIVNNLSQKYVDELKSAQLGVFKKIRSVAKKLKSEAARKRAQEAIDEGEARGACPQGGIICP